MLISNISFYANGLIITFRTAQNVGLNNSYTQVPQYLKAQAVAHERSEGATKGLRVYKLLRYQITRV